MLIIIPNVLPEGEAIALGRTLADAEWVDGNVTSGTGAALAKKNRQLPEGSSVLEKARDTVSRALAANGLFLSAALPRRIVPPLFNQYGPGDLFRPHVDNAIRMIPGEATQIRTDVSATLFLTDPEDYDGGALTVEGNFGSVEYKLPAGDLLLYPASSLHCVSQVTRGARISSFFWIESLVRDDHDREALFDLDQSIQQLTLDRGGDDAEVLRLTRLYHNLVRRWAVA